MAEVTVKQLAQVVGTPVEKLLEQLRDAGIVKSGEGDSISDEEKVTLLTHLRQSRGESTGGSSGGSKITLRRKRVSELKGDSSGRKKVNVEVRGRRTYVKPGEEAAEVPPEPVATPAAAEAPSVEPEATSPEAVEAVSTSAESAEVVADTAATEVAPTPVEASAVQTTSTADPAEAAAAAEAAAMAAADAVAAEVAKRVSAEPAVSETTAPAAEEASAPVAAPPVAKVSPEELAKQNAAAKARAAAEEQARSAAERQAEKHFAVEKRKENAETTRIEAERKEQQRIADEAQRRAAAEAQQAATTTDRGAGRKDNNNNNNNSKGRGKGKGGGGGDTRYGRNQLHVSKDKSGRRKGKPRRALPSNFESKHGFEKPTTPVVRDIDVPETITVAELANKMAVKAAEVIKSMMGMGVMATINQMLDQDTAILVVEEMGHKAIAMSDDDIEAALAEKISGDRSGDEAEPRPPVVTVMGHVDHGKTSLLDYIRHSRVAAGEAGGITQHIGAYQSHTDKGTITFLDTPGHAAFSSMRARGAQATDIVVLVVAADDGVMPQTIEGVQHAKSAGVPLIVAMNKMDKEGVDVERLRNELAQHDVISEAWGGDTQFMPVSALTGDGIDDLLDAIRLQAEVLELKASPEGAASGVVIEAALDKGKGPVATVLVQSGTLKRGQIMICGQETGRVRAMFDENGKSIEEAGPSMPVQVLGLSATPNAGDDMLVALDDKSARELAELREGKQRDARLADRRPAKLDDVFSQIKSGEVPTVNLVVKADVKGSFEAIRSSLEGLSTEEVSVRVIGGGVGGITESDANLALTSGATLVGFNTRADNAARRLIQENDIELRYYSVIYELIDLVKSVAGGLLAPEVRENIIGTAEVKDVFTSPKFGLIAGCMVIDGVVRRDEPIRVLRENVVIYEGELESLRRFKDDVNSVNMGTECGIGVKNYTDVKPGDQIEVFERTEVARTL